MTHPRRIIAASLAIFSTIIATGQLRPPQVTHPDSLHLLPDNLWDMADRPWGEARRNMIHRLSEEDYRQAAEELGIDVAAMKAVVAIESGASHMGFYAPQQPIINFDLTMFKRAASRKGINLSRYKKSHPEVFNRPNTSRYGNYQAAQYQRLKGALSIDSITAMENTFWGMFQIGGFNWRKCGTQSVAEFVERMSASEHEQLELFVEFIKSQGLDKYLRQKNWAAFARGYNGPGYAKRGYHKRLAAAYAKYKKEGK